MAYGYGRIREIYGSDGKILIGCMKAVRTAGGLHDLIFCSDSVYGARKIPLSVTMAVIRE